MSMEIKEVRGSFLGWILANILGVAALGALILILPFLTTIPGMVASTLIIGLPIGLAQWIAIRRLAPISILWIFTISIGLLLALGILRALPTGDLVDDESIAVLTAGFAVMGFTTGLIQWFLLRRQFTKSLVWLLGSTVGIGLGSVLVLATDLVNKSGIISIILVLLLYATATGLALEWIRGHDDHSHNRLPQAT
jgi:hypothetical protein